ncbi:MAG: hypothetical protein AMXMBFR66_05030 [Pseudomonadota bacterium]|nr:hypothetical protein [Rubrivivax sp.]
MHRDLPLVEPPVQVQRARALAAALLRAAGAALDRLALRLSRAEPAGAAAHPVLEFYAEAGAPEGALYVDGRLVGRLDGVRRL